MAHLKRIIHEVHRRSLWQVLGIYLAGSWVTLQVVGAVTESAGLPDWTPGMALVVLLVLLPVVMATAFVQEGMPGGSEAREAAAAVVGDGRVALGPEEAIAPEGLHHRVLSWRTVGLGALGAFTLLGLSIFAYFVMWSSGIGPVGNLQAQGVLEEGAPVILAELENRTDDEELGAVLTVALAADLAQSAAIRMYAGEELGDALGRMGLGRSDAVTPAIARELAVREGIPAWIEGEVGSVGSSFVLTARVVASADGRPAATFREAAPTEDKLLGALERLSREIRERVGESLRAINATPPLLQVTTPSLEALRKYTESSSLGQSNPRAWQLLDEAVTLDTAFAMAYRRLAAWHDNGGRTQAAGEAAESAFRHSQRLSRVERDLVKAAYEDYALHDLDAAAATYSSILLYAPREGIAIQNLSWNYLQRHLPGEALTLLEGKEAEGIFVGTVHLWRARLQIGDVAGARAAVEARTARLGRRLPDHLWQLALIAGRTGAVEEAHAWADSMRAGGNPVGALYYEALADIRMGRMKEASAHLGERADVQSRRGWHLAASWSRITRAWTVLQTDTSQALRLLEGVEADALRAGPDSVYFGTLGWGFLAAGSRDAALRVAAAAGGRSGPGLNENATRFLALVGALARGEYDLATYQAYEAGCVACDRPLLAEMEVAAGRLREAAEVFEETIGVPGQFDWDAAREPLYHERVAATYEELGDKAKAAEHYEAFAEMWAGADAALQPRVRRARGRAEVLRAPR